MARKKKRSLIDEIFGDSFFEDFEDMKGVTSGYSIRVTQTPQGTKVYAKVGKDVDVNALKRQLQKQYPNAQIEIEGGQPLIREISTKTIVEEKGEEE